MKARVALIHDDPGLRLLLSGLLRAWKRHQLEVETSGFELRVPSLWRRWMREADLVVVGLERQYELGTRAEGVNVAEQLAHAGRRVLVVGTAGLGDRVSTTAYWDICSKKTFLEAVDHRLRSAPPGRADFDELRGRFARMLEIPTGHAS